MHGVANEVNVYEMQMPGLKAIRILKGLHGLKAIRILNGLPGLKAIRILKGLPGLKAIRILNSFFLVDHNGTATHAQQ